MSNVVERILGGSEPGRVAGALQRVAGESLAVIEGSLPRALAGDRRQVHLYVAAYRRLADRVLGAVGEARPDLILFDERHGAIVVVESKAPGARPTEARWLRTALEQSAMSAPFSDWVGQMGVGKGAGLAFVALMRETLPGVEPLHPASKHRLPEWDLEAVDVLRFYRAVVDELERGETPFERVRAALGLSRTEFAALFGVKRQALDHWEAGGVPAERREKLATVEGIADLLLAKLKAERIPGVVRRISPAYGGRSALDAIAEGDQELVLAELRDAFDWAAAA